MLSHVRHTGLVVKDVEKSTEFYKGLGFQEVSRDIETGCFIEQVTGIEGARLEWVKLTLDGGVLLELLQYHAPGNVQVQMDTHPKFASNYLPNLHGCSHVAYSTSDIEACCLKIKELGGSIVNAPAQSPNGKVLVAYAYDPDGILMEIVEELLTEKPGG